MTFLHSSTLGLKKSLPAVQTLLEIKANHPEYLINSVERVEKVYNLQNQFNFTYFKCLQCKYAVMHFQNQQNILVFGAGLYNSYLLMFISLRRPVLQVSRKLTKSLDKCYSIMTFYLTPSPEQIGQAI